MRYLLAIVFPPAAVLLCGKPVQSMLNAVLTLLLWVPGMLHALFVVNGYHSDRRFDELLRCR